jgi:REP element-mobilizing transposase RayT
MRREKVDGRLPLQITQKLRPGLTTLRRKDLLLAFGLAAGRAKTFGLHVVHFSLLSNHIHMIVEAADNQALANGMRSLAGRFAKAVRRLSGMKGKVFLGRYHLRVVKSPTQMKNSLEYVLLNQCKHSKMLEHLDPFSSARFFPHWRTLLKRRWNDVLEWEVPHVSQRIESAGLSVPRTWLAREGWRRAVG